MASADKVIAALDGIDASSFANEVERVRARDAAFHAWMKLQSPWDIASFQTFVAMSNNACARTLHDAGVFKRWAEHGGGPQTSVALAEMTQTDPVLIKRLVRQLASNHLLVEVGRDTYAPTPWSTALGTDPLAPSRYCTPYETFAGAFLNLPAFLREEAGFRNPTDGRRGNFQHLHGAGTSFFAHLSADPTRSREFAENMTAHSRDNLRPWPELFPTSVLLDVDGAAAEQLLPGGRRPLLVDVGGGRGHDLKKFLAANPGRAVRDGSLVLEDLPDVVAHAEADDPAIRVVPYDFFTPQPIKGARAYFMHNILHDWSDELATEIARGVAGAMERGYSRLLVHEIVLGDVAPQSIRTTSDITMMALFSAGERSETQWRDLLAAAGLRVVRLWSSPTGSSESVIEAELA
ncbi:O-methyltransferase [Xylariaceae sp. FL0804]|nr:O-methyltransferase [Xylariaceae sp. FL0804]